MLASLQELWSLSDLESLQTSSQKGPHLSSKSRTDRSVRKIVVKSLPVFVMAQQRGAIVLLD